MVSSKMPQSNSKERASNQSNIANILQTYNRVGNLGSRKLSTQNKTNSTKNNPKAICKNQWVGPNSLPGTNMSFSSNQHPSNYSNIINNHNNIQGVQINYSNQIIQNGVPTNIPEGIPIQQFANTLIMGQNFARGRPEIKEKFQEQSSNESLLNSHRRCKSQNVRGDPSEEGTSSVMDKKKTSTNKKKNGKGDVIRGGSKTGNYNQDMADEILILHQGNSAGPQVSKKVDPVIMNLEKRVNDDSFVSNGQGTLENFN